MNDPQDMEFTYNPWSGVPMYLVPLIHSESRKQVALIPHPESLGMREWSRRKKQTYPLGTWLQLLFMVRKRES